MSKIIEALDKAKNEGRLERTTGQMEALEALARVDHPVSIPPEKVRKRRQGQVGLLNVKVLSPEVLHGVDSHIQTLHDPMSVVSEQYRALRNRIERLSHERRLQTLAISSATKGEGKSITAVNLAAAMAQDSAKRILIVDADLRRPAIHRLLNLELSPGLPDFLQGTAVWEEVLRETPYFGLSVVTAGNAAGHPSELLASSEFISFLSRARSEFDQVILDTPPLHPVSDVSFLAESVDGLLIVVQANRTSKGALTQAVEHLPSGKIIGTLLNRASNLGHGYRNGKAGYYGYYYKYY